MEGNNRTLNLFQFPLNNNNRELKHRRFGATDGNRKATVIVFSAFSTTRMRWRALVLAFVS